MNTNQTNKTDTKKVDSTATPVTKQVDPKLVQKVNTTTPATQVKSKEHPTTPVKDVTKATTTATTKAK